MGNLSNRRKSANGMSTKRRSHTHQKWRKYDKNQIANKRREASGFMTTKTAVSRPQNRACILHLHLQGLNNSNEFIIEFEIAPRKSPFFSSKSHNFAFLKRSRGGESQWNFENIWFLRKNRLSMGLQFTNHRNQVVLCCLSMKTDCKRWTGFPPDFPVSGFNIS